MKRVPAAKRGQVLRIDTAYPTLAEIPKSDKGEANTVIGTTRTSVFWPDNWHQLSAFWRAVLLRELVHKVIGSFLGRGDEQTFEEFKRLTGWGNLKKSKKS